MKCIYNDGGRKAAGYEGRAGDCVARAIAIIAELDYATVYAELAEINAKMRLTTERKKKTGGKRSARNGIFTKTKPFKDYMAGLGFRWVPTMQIGQGCKVHLADGELPPGRLIAVLSRHYTAVVDGVVHDTYNPQRSTSWTFEPDKGQDLKANQGRNENGIWTEVGGRCVYGYWMK